MSLFKVLWPYRHPDPRVQEEIFRLLKETDENFNEHRLIGLIESLKKKSQSVDFVDFYGKTALHLAAGRGLTSVVMLLVSAHANIEAQDKLLGRPVICFAIENGHKETVKCLYDLGASIKKKKGRKDASPLGIRLWPARRGRLSSRCNVHHRVGRRTVSRDASVFTPFSFLQQLET
jgi:ankyrin repeat protein